MMTADHRMDRTRTEYIDIVSIQATAPVTRGNNYRPARPQLCRQVSYMYSRLFMVALWNRADHIYFHPVSFFFFISSPNFTARMWANAQRNGRPAEYRRCPVLNAAKFGRRPLLDCSAVTLQIGL